MLNLFQHRSILNRVQDDTQILDRHALDEWSGLAMTIALAWYILNMLNNIGLTEILVVSAVLLVLFGGKRLPEFAKGLSQAIKEFRDAFKEEDQSSKKK